MALCLLAMIVALGAVTPAVSAWDDEATATNSDDFQPTAAEEAAMEAGCDALSEEAVGEATSDDKISLLEAASAENDYVINTLFMMLCAVLVILMQPGFAMLEVGLNSQKNTVNILFKNTMIVAIGLLTYAILGFNLMYPGEFSLGGWFGFAGWGISSPEGAAGLIEYAGGGYTYWTDFLFQAMFAATGATIVSGAVAGRIKLRSFLVFTIFFVGLIYPWVGSWKWGGGWLDQMGFYDFAGSTLVHSVGGWGENAAEDGEGIDKKHSEINLSIAF